MAGVRASQRREGPGVLPSRSGSPVQPPHCPPHQRPSSASAKAPGQGVWVTCTCCLPLGEIFFGGGILGCLGLCSSSWCTLGREQFGEDGRLL